MTDRHDGPDDSVSSEDLIRQAREAYVPPGDAPTVPADRVPTDHVSAAAPPTGLEPTDSPAVSPAPPADDFSRPSDYVSADYGQPIPAAPGVPATYEAQRPSFFSRFGRLIIFGVIILGVIVYNVLDRTKSVEDLSVGDCLRMPDAEEISDIESADCASDHELEVFALVTIPAGETAPYPGEFAVGEQIFELCLPRFESYIGMNFQSSAWYINAIYPTAESWNDFGDREGTCVVYQPGLNDEPMTLTGVARNSNT